MLQCYYTKKRPFSALRNILCSQSKPELYPFGTVHRLREYMLYMAYDLVGAGETEPMFPF